MDRRNDVSTLTIMFYEGDIQGGIAQALQESKSVVCFVKGTRTTQNTGFYDKLTASKDGSEESDRWENEWLTDQNVSAPKK